MRESFSVTLLAADGPLLVTVSVNITGVPITALVAEAISVTAISVGFTATDWEEVLSPVFRSGWSAVTLKFVAKIPPNCIVMAKLIVAFPPEANVPSEHVRLAVVVVQFPWLVVSELIGKSAESAPAKTTVVAVAGPAFATVIV